MIALMAWIFISLQWKLIEDTSYHPLTEDPVAWATALALPWVVHRARPTRRRTRGTRAAR